MAKLSLAEIPLRTSDAEGALIEEPKLTDRQLKGFKRRLQQDGDCLIWTGAFNQQWVEHHLSPNTRKVAPHRINWLLGGRELRRGQRLSHSCGNILCCLPEHLYLIVKAPSKPPKEPFRAHTGRDLPYGVYRTGGGYIARATIGPKNLKYLGFSMTPEGAAEIVETAKRAYLAEAGLTYQETK